MEEEKSAFFSSSSSNRNLANSFVSQRETNENGNEKNFEA